MRRGLDDVVVSLREHIRTAASGRHTADLRVLVYPPAWEAALLARLPDLAAECEREGCSLDVVDVGQRFRAELEGRPHRLQLLLRDDSAGKPTLPNNLGTLATTMLEGIAHAHLEQGVCRLLVNTGALATFVSYSAVANRLYADVPGATVLLFPGEGDDRALNILGLRADPTYRTPRI